MAPRPYQLGRRETAVQETRQRVIDAARAMIVEEGFHRTSLEDIARRADVSRATVYYQFTNKRGLLEAVIDETMSLADGRSVVASYQLEDPSAAAVSLLREVTRFWKAQFPIFQKVLGLSAVDPDVRDIVLGRVGAREPIMWGLVRRLESAGKIRAGFTANDAFDTLWLFTSFPPFEVLYEVRGLSAETVAERFIHLSRSVIDL